MVFFFFFFFFFFFYCLGYFLSNPFLLFHVESLVYLHELFFADLLEAVSRFGYSCSVPFR